MRADRARQLLPLVEDSEWFFDTELLVLAQRSGMRIHEVPVDWTDDPDSRVDIVATALADLRGIKRMALRGMQGQVPIAPVESTPPGLPNQLVRFLLVGIGSWNFDRYSADNNHESAIFCLDDALREQMERQIVLDLVNSVPIIHQ